MMTTNTRSGIGQATIRLKIIARQNLPNESSPLFNMLSLIVFGIETRLVVALNVFFFFGFSKSA